MGSFTRKPLAVLSGSLVAGFLLCSCTSREPTPPDTKTRPTGQTTSPAPARVSGAAILTINDVLQLWAEDRKDSAVALFLELVDQHAPPAALRPSQLSEEQFVSLPRGERERLQAELLATFKQTRLFAKHIEHLGNEALAKGDTEKAKRYFEALHRLGATNMGPDVTKLANMIGELAVKLAQRGFEAVDASPDTLQGSIKSPTEEDRGGG